MLIFTIFICTGHTDFHNLYRNATLKIRLRSPKYNHVFSINVTIHTVLQSDMKKCEGCASYVPEFDIDLGYRDPSHNYTRHTILLW